jgi:phosphate transport system permease protein
MGMRHRISPRVLEKVAFGGLWVTAGVVVVPVFAVIAYMLMKGFGALRLDMFAVSTEGLLPAIVGSSALVLLTGLIAAPLGVAAAVYLTEYAHEGPLVRLIRLAIVNLAGVPSVVYGLFGLALFVMLLGFGRCLLAGACTLALLVLPLVISTSEEALRQVPHHLRQASWALGATRWQTIRRIVLPNAFPGIITGLILSIGRAAGETAPILFTAAFYSLTHPFPRSVFDEILVLPYQLFVMATEAPDVTLEEKWATAFVLVALVVGLNIAAIVLRARLRKARRW